MSLTDRLESYFRVRPHVWIDGVTLEATAGRYAWRSRVSDCRRLRGMDIRNRQQRMTDASGKTWTVSWYMFVPPGETEPAGPGDAHARLFGAYPHESTFSKWSKCSASGKL